MDRMRILQLSEDFYPETSGGASEDWETAKGMADAGHDVTVVTPLRNDTPEQETEMGVEILRPHPAETDGRDRLSVVGIVQRVRFAILATIYVLDLSKSKSFDAVYVTNYLLHSVGWILSFRRRLRLVNLIAYSPSNAEESRRLSNPLYVLEQLNIRLFMGDVVLCRTPVIRDMVEQRTNSEVRLAEGILQPSEIRQAVHTDCTEHPTEAGGTLVFVGRLDENKNPIGALDIVAALPQHHLLIIGDGTLRPVLEDEISERGLTERVTLMGQRSHGLTLACIHQADVLILTSRNEAYPTVVFESLSLQTPVVALPVGILPEVDHPHLKLCSTGDMQQSIKQLEIKSERGVDEETLKRFSIDRFVTDVLWALNAAAQ